MSHTIVAVDLAYVLVFDLGAYFVKIGSFLELCKEALNFFVYFFSFFLRFSLPLSSGTFSYVHLAGGSVVPPKPEVELRKVVGLRLTKYQFCIASKNSDHSTVPL